MTYNIYGVYIFQPSPLIKILKNSYDIVFLLNSHTSSEIRTILAEIFLEKQSSEEEKGLPKILNNNVEHILDIKVPKNSYFIGQEKQSMHPRRDHSLNQNVVLNFLSDELG